MLAVGAAVITGAHAGPLGHGAARGAAGLCDFYPYAEKDGKLYRAGARAGWFIMMKMDPATADTDAGWVYGTVGADGRVTAAGRIDSCMSCHDMAPHDRLFGVATQ